MRRRGQPETGGGAGARVRIGAVMLALGVGAPGPTPLATGAENYAWHVTRAEWSERDEVRFSEFVSELGDAVERRECNTVQSCLNGRVRHAYRATNPPGMVFRADCADLPYLLRAYFAWKNGLPFSYADAVAPRPGSRGDIRYSSHGNLVRSRASVTGSGGPVDARVVLQRLRSAVRSGHFRIRHHAGDPELPDFYPVAIRPGAVRAGTVLYDPKGHVAVVYKVTPGGRVYYIDAHPDNTLTRGTYGVKFTQASRPDSAPGFKNWRPLRVGGGIAGSPAPGDGRAPVAGRLRTAGVALRPNAGIADYSDEQLFGTAPADPDPRPGDVSWSAREFRVDGQVLGFHDFVRRRLAGAGLRFDPREELRTGLRDLCVDLEYRQLAIEEALRTGIHRRPQPDRLPDNIYGTSGEWETYSTPARDARLKTSATDLYDQVARFLAMHERGDPALDYARPDLRADLLAIYRAEAAACRVTYLSSRGEARTLDLHEMIDRLFRLSFDPYHCVERRWGATEADELASCDDGPVKTAWYRAQQALRNQIERRYDVPMGFSLSELRAGGPGRGEAVAPEVAIWNLLGAELEARAEP